MSVFFPRRWGNVPHGGFRSIFMRQIGGLGSPASTPAAQHGHWDTSDPLFYDWWRKRAQEERQKLEVVETVAEIISDPPLREQTIEAIEAATSIDEIRSLDLLTHELNALQAAIDEYQKFLDEDEEEAVILLLMH